MPAFPYLLKSSSHPNPEPREGRRTRPHLGTPLCTPAPALAPKHASSPWGSSRDSVLRARYVASCPQTTDIEGPQCSDQQPRGRGALRLITAPLLTAGAAQPLWTPFFTCKPGCLELLPGLPVPVLGPTWCSWLLMVYRLPIPLTTLRSPQGKLTLWYLPLFKNDDPVITRW